ncbi:MAG: hypothetical protein EOO61_17620 [Hymenobacter sp.]|nr:MAG: hypothetical protein EOO61_17620 [Hymenobacter sp.]
MKRAITSIWIGSEQFGPVVGGAATTDDNTDVRVDFRDGASYVATFFTYENIASLRKKNVATGECLAGRYFWASDMILIDRIERSSILQVIEVLLEDNSFDNVFTKVE